MPRLKAYLSLVRVDNLILTFLSVLVGAYLESGEILYSSIWIAGLSAIFLAAGGYVINDFWDKEIDKINKPHRPLPAGLVSPKTAWYLSFLLFLLGIISACLVNHYVLIVSIATAIFLFFYSFKLKKTFMLGNILVSFWISLAFIYGGLVFPKVSLSLIPAHLAFFFHWGREIVKDLQDREGDQTFWARTVPIYWGIKKTMVLVTAIFGSLILLSGVPYFLKIFNWRYLILVILGVDLVLIYVIISLWKDWSKENLARLSGILKLDMLMGLLAIVMAKI
ncbi:MAG: hypothetical protein A2145_07115 [candidate division Zixibacteria bacterium RBG_16_40_9]|nr:MAG: hypothetical protein A2145_07115 [candidate division Zixibacteria bacterium RBG_16_40_9]